jgi:UDP-glucose 4-epimerase
LVANPALAEGLLNWRAQKDLIAMVEDAWRWHLRLHPET